MWLFFTIFAKKNIMEEYIETKIEEFAKFSTAISIEKDTDNYNKLKNILLDVSVVAFMEYIDENGVCCGDC